MLTTILLFAIVYGFGYLYGYASATVNAEIATLKALEASQKAKVAALKPREPGC